MLKKGLQVGNYVVEAEIGGGGMARLYRVRHAVLGTLHALKVLEHNYRENEEVRSRFLGEGMIAAKLNHPNIVRVTDTVSTPDVAGLVMELIQGPNLEQYIRGLRSPPNEAEVHQLFLPTLSAIGEAHRRGIVHRDIKPANILLESTPTGFCPKVTDFGIAKVTQAATMLVHKKASTNADARMGTLAYMSPEQVRGAKEVTARSDIFSLGATLYELATCKIAFDGDSDYDVMHKIVEGKHMPPEMVPGIAQRVASAIRKALQSKPEDRFASCEEFADALSVESVDDQFTHYGPHGKRVVGGSAHLPSVSVPGELVRTAPGQSAPVLLQGAMPAGGARHYRVSGEGSGLVVRKDLIANAWTSSPLGDTSQQNSPVLLQRAPPLAPPVSPLTIVRPNESNSMATAGFVCSLLGLTPLWIGFLLCVLGIVFSSIGYTKARQMDGRGRGLAIAGLVLGILFVLPAMFGL